MSKVIRVNSRMCRNARGLLKWNTRDLCIRAKIQLQRLMEFEHGQIQLLKSENEMIFHAFVHAGITFGDNGEITLTRFHKSSMDDETQDDTSNHSAPQNTQAVYTPPPPTSNTPHPTLSEEEKVRQEWWRLYGHHHQPPTAPYPPESPQKD